MSRQIIQLLSVSERDFSSFIKRVESVTLNPGIDIKLASEIQHNVRNKISELGLDSEDTTSKELFYALKSKLSDDDGRLKKLLKAEGKNAEQLAKIFAKYSNQLCASDQVLCLTTAGAKRVLSAVPPRKTMKLLKLRSLESVLKREDAKVLFTLALLIEDSSWISQVHAKIKRLQSRDIAWQPVTFSTIPSKWLDKVQDKLQLKGLSISSPEVGSVIAIPVIEKLVPGATVLALCHLLQLAHKLSTDSMPHLLHGLSRGYDSVLLDISVRRKHELTTIHGIIPSWAVVHDLVARGSLQVEDLIEDVTIKDVSQHTLEERLALLSSDFTFWVNTSYLGYIDAFGISSLNILDVAKSLVLNYSFEQKSNQNMEKSLWDEMQIRYLQQDNLLRTLIKQLQTTPEGVVL